MTGESVWCKAESSSLATGRHGGAPRPRGSRSPATRRRPQGRSRGGKALGAYARSSNPHKKRDMWGYGLDDSRGDRAMDVELRREQRQNQDDFLERMEQSGDFTPAEMALLAQRKQGHDGPKDLIRMQQKRERIEQNMEAKKTQIGTASSDD